MTDQPSEFRPLTFKKTTHGELRPPISDNDSTRGTDYYVGQLLSLSYAKNALLFTARFTPGPDGIDSGTHEVEFFLVKQKGRYLGAINRQLPDRQVYFSNGDKVSVLDGLGQRGLSHPGRQKATFFCSTWGASGSRPITIGVYVKPGFFGGWSEVVIKLPKKELFVARV
jgi:hypothetical protein